MRIDPLLKIIKENKNHYKQLNIPIHYREICEEQEQGQEITFTILNKNYKVGYLYITEDQDDWAQAESYQVDWCQENEKEIPICVIDNNKDDDWDNVIKQIEEFIK